MSLYEDFLQHQKGANGPDSIATCFSCGTDVEIATGEINNCAHCDEPICIGCRKVHQDECGRDCTDVR